MEQIGTLGQLPPLVECTWSYVNYPNNCLFVMFQSQPFHGMVNRSPSSEMDENGSENKEEVSQVGLDPVPFRVDHLPLPMNQE